MEPPVWWFSFFFATLKIGEIDQYHVFAIYNLCPFKSDYCTPTNTMLHDPMKERIKFPTTSSIFIYPFCQYYAPEQMNERSELRTRQRDNIPEKPKIKWMEIAQMKRFADAIFIGKYYMRTVKNHSHKIATRNRDQPRPVSIYYCCEPKTDEIIIITIIHT